MKDFSTVLLINVLQATVDHAQKSSEIDQSSPEFREFSRTLLAEIVGLRASDPGPEKFMADEIQQARNGIL